MGDKNDLQKKNHKTLVGMKKICFRDEPNQYREQISTEINEVKTSIIWLILTLFNIFYLFMIVSLFVVYF